MWRARHSAWPQHYEHNLLLIITLTTTIHLMTRSTVSWHGAQSQPPVWRPSHSSPHQPALQQDMNKMVRVHLTSSHNAVIAYVRQLRACHTAQLHHIMTLAVQRRQRFCTSHARKQHRGLHICSFTLPNSRPRQFITCRGVQQKSNFTAVDVPCSAAWQSTSVYHMHS